jgi:hypothetical protein
MSGELAAERITTAGTGRDPGHALRDDGGVHPARPLHLLQPELAHPQRDQRAAKNPVLATVYTQVNARLQALRFRSNQDGEKWKVAMKEHEKMIEALAARDGAAMREVLQTHLRNKRDVVLEQVREANGSKRKEPNS